VLFKCHWHVSLNHYHEFTPLKRSNSGFVVFISWNKTFLETALKTKTCFTAFLWSQHVLNSLFGRLILLLLNTKSAVFRQWVVYVQNPWNFCKKTKIKCGALAVVWSCGTRIWMLKIIYFGQKETKISEHTWRGHMQYLKEKRRWKQGVREWQQTFLQWTCIRSER